MMEQVSDKGGDDVTSDAFLGGRLKILQPRKGFRAGIDSVILAASVPARAGDLVLEAGVGPGVPALCLMSRVDGVCATGVELQAGPASLARQNAQANALPLSVVEADISWPKKQLTQAGLAQASFDHVMANPPYYDPAAAALALEPGKAIAHATMTGDLAAWVRFCCTMVKPGGTVTLVHRVEALPLLIEQVGPYLGGLVGFPLWPSKEAQASRIILQGRRGAKAPFRLSAGLVLHDKGGGFTREAEDILRHGAPSALAQS